VVEFYLKLKLILRIISYLTYICWEIDNFVIKSDIFRRFFICKDILKKLSCYHDNYFRYFMLGKYNGFVSKAKVSACMYFLVLLLFPVNINECRVLQVPLVLRFKFKTDLIINWIYPIKTHSRETWGNSKLGAESK
jgi:hypothetical protein